MKKFIKFFTLVLTICFAVTLSVSANGAIDNDTTQIYTAGAPITLYTRSYIDGNMYSFVDPQVNVYTFSTGVYTPYMGQSINGTSHSTTTYTLAGEGADIQQTFVQSAIIDGIAIYEPMFLDIDNYTVNDNYYTTSIGIRNPYYFANELSPPVYLDTLHLVYRYNVATARYDDAGNIVGYYTQIYRIDRDVDVSNDGWARFYTIYNADIDLIQNDGATWHVGDNHVIWVMGMTIEMDERTATDSIYYEAYPTNTYTLYNDYLQRSREMEMLVLNDGSADIYLDNFDLTSWLTNSVKSFMDFQIIPGLSFAGILSILLGIPLLVWFLRLFAGG